MRNEGDGSKPQVSFETDHPVFDRASVNPFGEVDRPTRQSALEALAELRAVVSEVKEELRLSRVERRSQASELGELKSAITETNLMLARLQAPLRPNGLSGRCILIVEDDPALAKMLVTCFKELGANVLYAQSRQRAEEWLASFGDDFDAALVDLHLPRSEDGIDLCRWISRFHKSIALVVMSGKLDAVELDTLAAARLQKPFRLHDLVDLLKQVIGYKSPAPGSDVGGAETLRPPALALVHPPPGDVAPPITPEPTTLVETPDAIRSRGQAP